MSIGSGDHCRARPPEAGLCSISPGRHVLSKNARPIEAQQHIPASSWDRLHPIVLLTGGRRRSKKDVDRTIGIDFQRSVLAANTRKLLVGLNHRMGLVIHCSCGFHCDAANRCGVR
jgi:hypothetical protein